MIEPCITFSFFDGAPFPFMLAPEPPFPCENPPIPVGAEPEALETPLDAAELEPLPGTDPEPGIVFPLAPR